MSQGHSIGSVAGHASHGVHYIVDAFEHAKTPGEAFFKGAAGAVGVCGALLPVVAISLPVVAAASIAVGAFAGIRKMLD